MTQDNEYKELKPIKPPKVTSQVLQAVDQLNAKFTRLTADIQVQERISKQLDAQLIQSRNQHSQITSDLIKAQQELENQKQRHQQTVIQAQQQAKMTDQFNLEFMLRKKEKADVHALIEKQKEQYSIAQASCAKYKLIIEDLERKVQDQKSKKEQLLQQNQNITSNINCVGKNVQQLNIKNQVLCEELEELRKQLVE